MTQTIKMSLPHRLTQDEARSRIQNAISNLRANPAAKFASVNESWNANHMDFSLTAMGQTATGRVDVDPDNVRLEIDLPPFLAMFAGKFKQQVETEGRKLLQ